MGLDLHAAKLLMLAKREGADFKRTLTLGRQWLHVDSWDLKSLQRDMNVDIDAVKFARMSDTFPYADGFIMAMGAEEVASIDASPYENASIIHDMNTDIPSHLEQQFSLVVDFGTLEHVFNFPVAVRNCMRLLRVGGHFLVVTNANNFMGHGFYQFSPELFCRVLSAESGFRVRRMFVSEVRRCAAWYEVQDPSVIRQRVELTNTMPTYLLVLAEKVAPTPLRAPVPQQSDYEQLSWSGQRKIAQRLGEGGGAMLRRITPDWLRALRSILMTRLKPAYGAICFRKVDKSLR